MGGVFDMMIKPYVVTLVSAVTLYRVYPKFQVSSGSLVYNCWLEERSGVAPRFVHRHSG